MKRFLPLKAAGVLPFLIALIGTSALAGSSLPERLSQSDPRSTLDYLESYRRDWRDDEKLQLSQLRRACRRVNPQARRSSIRDRVTALSLIAELPSVLENRRMLDPRGLDLGLRDTLRKYGQSGFNADEARSFSELFSSRAQDRLQLFDRVIESQWLLVRVADRQYDERISALIEAGGKKVGLFRGNASLCSALTLRIERDRALGMAAGNIQEVIQRLVIELGE